MSSVLVSAENVCSPKKTDILLNKGYETNIGRLHLSTTPSGIVSCAVSNAHTQT